MKKKKSRRFLSAALGTLQLSINVLLWLNASKETSKTRVFLLHPLSKFELHLVLCGTWWGSIGVEDRQVWSGNICGSGRCCRESCSWKWWKRLADLRIKMQMTQERNRYYCPEVLNPSPWYTLALQAFYFLHWLQNLSHWMSPYKVPLTICNVGWSLFCTREGSSEIGSTQLLSTLN